jgi:CBS domain-containing protein
LVHYLEVNGKAGKQESSDKMAMAAAESLEFDAWASATPVGPLVAQQQVVTVHKGDTVQSAWMKLASNGISSAPVLDETIAATAGESVIGMVDFNEYVGNSIPVE